jgi:hypothetical protein
MASLPVEFLLGLYLGVLTGIVPAVVSWGLGFLFKYATGVSIPGFGVVVLALAIAGASGGLLALNDPSVTGSVLQIRLSVALLVVLMLSLYAHSVGDRMGANLPRRISLSRLTRRSLSTDVVELVGGRGQVRVTVAGAVSDIEGYAPLPADLRAQIRDGEWTFPADVPLAELETRFADRLRTEFDLPEVSVRLDERARATVAAAPPAAGVSKRVPTGKRAVSLSALVPTGLARGDAVRIVADGTVHEGSVVAVRSGDGGGAETTAVETPEAPAATDGGTVADGGEGRVTVAVDRDAAGALLAAPPERLVVVRSRGTHREFELVTLLRRAGRRFRRVAVAPDSALDGTTLGEVAVRDAYGVAVLAVRHEGRWTVAPRGSQGVVAGDEVYVVGAADALARFQEAVA